MKDSLRKDFTIWRSKLLLNFLYISDIIRRHIQQNGNHTLRYIRYVIVINFGTEGNFEILTIVNSFLTNISLLSEKET